MLSSRVQTCRYTDVTKQTLAQDKGQLYSEPAKYRRLIGRLVYLTVRKPDLSYAVHTLAQFLQKPRLRHWEAALRVVRYLKNDPGQGIFLSAKNNLTLSAYCDSDWTACPLTRRSLTRYVIMLGESLVSWKTRSNRLCHDCQPKLSIGPWP